METAKQTPQERQPGAAAGTGLKQFSLFLLRHAKSSWDAPDLDDFDRPLAERGHRAAAAMAGHMAGLGLRPELILCSSACRTRQTLDYLATVLDGVPVVFEKRLYTFSGSSLLDRLREVPATVGSVLVVGHNPAMQELALALTEGKADDSDQASLLREKFPTGALASLGCSVKDWASLGRGTATLHTFTRPRDLLS